MKKKTRMIFDSKDVKFLEYLYSFKVASIDQIRRDIYFNMPYKTVMGRLWKMKQISLITTVPGLEENRKNLYSLTAKGFKTVYGADDNVRKQLKSHAPSHDLILIDVKKRFCQYQGVLSYYTENELRSGLLNDLSTDFLKTVVPDGIVHLFMKGNDYHFAVEYERNKKSTQRYQDLISKYYMEEYLAGVFFIADDEGLIKNLMDIERNQNKTKYPKFFYQQTNNFLFQNELVFKNYDQKELSFKLKKYSRIAQSKA